MTTPLPYREPAPRDSDLYKDGLRHGVWTKHHPNGQLAEEYHWERGVQHGAELDWAENGQLICRGQHTHGTRSGTWTWWHANGVEQCTETYDAAGKKQGPYAWRDAAGVLEITGAFLDDKPHGAWWWRSLEPYARVERAYERGVQHGPELAFHRGGAVAIQRTWLRGVKHGEERTFDASGRPVFHGAWDRGVPVGTHVTWEAGVEQHVVFEHGLPKALIADRKLAAQVVAKLARAREAYAKRDAFDDVEDAYRAAYLAWLWRTDQVDVASDPGLWDLLAEAHPLLSGKDVVALLDGAKTRGVDGALLPAWPATLDRIVMEVYARDPKPIDAAWKRMPKPLRAGCALVRARFGQDIGIVLHAEMRQLVKHHIARFGLDEILWPDAHGVVQVESLRHAPDGTKPPIFAKLIALFGGDTAWVEALRWQLSRKLKNKDSLAFPLFREAIAYAPHKELPRLVGAIALDSETHLHVQRALTVWRRERPADLARIALGVDDDDGVRKWSVVSVALLAHAAAGLPAPTALVDALPLASESPNYSSAWAGDAQQRDPYVRVARLPSEPGYAVPRTQLLRQALATLPAPELRAVIERHLAAGKQEVAQFLYLVDDPALWARALDVLEASDHGHGDAAMYGVGELGLRVVPLLEQRLAKTTSPARQLGYRKALVVALARAVIDTGTYPVALDRHVDFAIGPAHEFAAYGVMIDRILCTLPRERAEAILVRALGEDAESSRSEAERHVVYARAFARLATCPTRRVLETAFRALRAREATLGRAQQREVCEGIAALPDAIAWTTWLVREGGGATLGETLRRTIGLREYEQVEHALAERALPHCTSPHCGRGHRPATPPKGLAASLGG